MVRIRRMVLSSLVVYSLQSLFFANVALSASPQAKAPAPTTQDQKAPVQTQELAPDQQPAAEQAQQPVQNSNTMFLKSSDEFKEFVSEGQTIVFEDLGLQLYPINGWNVTTGGGMTAIMQEPVDEKAPVDYTKPKFRRNITVSTIHKALPLDETRAEELKAQLLQKFGKDSYVQNFQVIEHKWIDQRAKGDALLIYSSMTIDKYDMMQAHIVLGGEDKQYLLSYTDFAADFKDTNPVYAAAWQSMLSTVVKGEAPKRFDFITKYAPFAGIALILLIIGMIAQHISSVRALRSLSDNINSHEFEEQGSNVRLETSSAIWNLNSRHDVSDVTRVSKLSKKSSKVSNLDVSSYDIIEESDEDRAKDRDSSPKTAFSGF